MVIRVGVEVGDGVSIGVEARGMSVAVRSGALVVAGLVGWAGAMIWPNALKLLMGPRKIQATRSNADTPAPSGARRRCRDAFLLRGWGPEPPRSSGGRNTCVFMLSASSRSWAVNRRSGRAAPSPSQVLAACIDGARANAVGVPIESGNETTGRYRLPALDAPLLPSYTALGDRRMIVGVE